MHRRTWTEFIADYRDKVLNHQKWSTWKAYNEAIGHLERICHPGVVADISTKVIEESVSKRRTEMKGKNEPKKISLNSVNKALRHIRTILRSAHRWGYLPIVPEFKMLKTADPEPRAMPPHIFRAHPGRGPRAG